MGSVYLKHIAPVEIFFTTQLFEGIWYADNEYHLYRNCRRLRIRLDTIEEKEDGFEVKEFERFLVYTTISKESYTQFVFSKDALSPDVKKVTAAFPYRASQWLFGKGHFPKEKFTWQALDLPDDND